VPAHTSSADYIQFFSCVTCQMNKQNAIPDRRTCIEIIDASDMLPHIKKHSQAVCRVAVAIARELNTHNENYDLREIEAAALLHDITKTRSLATGENHSVTGAEAIAALGYHGVADIIRQHVTPDNDKDRITAAEIVSYADKRVLHDRVVPLHERFAYLKIRYGRSSQDMERIDAARQRTESIEQRIADKLPGGIPDTFYACSDNE
jgi:putative nucleotidyltransferase with HDIG domain